MADETKEKPTNSGPRVEPEVASGPVIPSAVVQVKNKKGEVVTYLKLDTKSAKRLLGKGGDLPNDVFANFAHIVATNTKAKAEQAKQSEQQNDEDEPKPTIFTPKRKRWIAAGIIIASLIGVLANEYFKNRPVVIDLPAYPIIMNIADPSLGVESIANAKGQEEMTLRFYPNADMSKEEIKNAYNAKEHSKFEESAQYMYEHFGSLQRELDAAYDILIEDGHTQEEKNKALKDIDRIYKQMKRAYGEAITKMQQGLSAFTLASSEKLDVRTQDEIGMLDKLIRQYEEQIKLIDSNSEVIGILVQLIDYGYTVEVADLTDKNPMVGLRGDKQLETIVKGTAPNRKAAQTLKDIVEQLNKYGWQNPGK